MKKIILILTLSIALFSCKSTNTTTANQSQQKVEEKKQPEVTLDKIMEVMVKGDWTLTKISYVGSDYFRVKSFQMADSRCFLGSQWHFISNNNKGEMSMKATNCPDFTSPIVWSISKEKMFSLKILKDEKANEVKVGFYLILRNQTKESFELIDNLNVGGKQTDIIYTFQRNQ